MFQSLTDWLIRIGPRLQRAFIEGDRWKLYLQGLGTTLELTVIALIFGVMLGLVVAVVRSAHDQQRLGRKRNPLLGILNVLCQIYTTVIRGTPMLVQLFIWTFVIFPTQRNKVLVAFIGLGVNSGAYVAEIFRSGIMSIDNGQFEAGRSLGFNYTQTMLYIIMPQAFKNVLPALGNEFIVLLKETSVAGYIAIQDLTKGADIIRSRTYSAFMPLMAAAVIYLVMVMIFTYFVQRLERRLRSSDH